MKRRGRITAGIAAMCLGTLCIQPVAACAETTERQQITWYFKDMTYETGADEPLRIPLYVCHSEELNGFNLALRIDDRPVSESPFDLTNVEIGDAYPFHVTYWEAETGDVRASCDIKAVHKAEDDSVMLWFELTPDTARIKGRTQTYTISVTNCICGDWQEKGYRPEVRDAVLTILNPDAPPLSGDVDGSGEVNILDVIAVNKFTVGCKVLDASQCAAADVNQDDEVNAEDSLLILKTALGI